MKKLVIFCSLTIFLFVTCKKKDTDKSDTYTPACTGTKSFVNDVFPLLQSKCHSCHTNMDNYAECQVLAASMKDMVISGIMPKNDKLTNAQKDVIVCWVEAGAPNN